MIYIAGPFFNLEERTKLLHMIDLVKEAYPDEELFIPMEHFVPDGENMPNYQWAEEVFKLDVEALNKADRVIALYLGHYSDTGTAWEIGYAYAKGIPVTIVPDGIVPKDYSIMPIISSGSVYGTFMNLK